MACNHIWCIGSVLLVFSYLFIGQASAQTVTLTSSVEEAGRQVACPGEVVTFTCMVTDGSSLRWIAEPFINGRNPITFLVSSAPGDMVVDGSGLFRAGLTSVVPNGLFGHFTSELTVTASETLGGTVIQCLDTAATLMNKPLTLAAPPSPPQQPRYSMSQYALDSFTVTVQWESPASDGGVGIDNYTVTAAGITAPLTVLSNGPLTALVTLSYNEIHMVSITASNCAGESTASVVTIREVGCGPPTPPPRGSLGDLTSSQEETEVTFQCSPELVPSQEMISVCMANGRWTPDPAELVCTADCGDPSPPLNGFVMAYDSALEGSQIVFQCSSGFAPSQQMMSVCAANGNWTPNPAGLQCRIDCGIPIIVSGSVNYTTTVEGSTATYQCDVGLLPDGIMIAVCMGNREWDPDPADVGCRLPADCGMPTIVNGAVSYTTTVEGSTATYQCDTGLIPEGVMTAVCMGNGEWAPDPADAGCRLPADCGIPVVIDGSVNYTSTVEGSTATYQCDTGLIPEGVIIAVCMENGKWAPDPIIMGCRLPGQATCGVPPSPNNGFVDFTNVIEGSEATFRCDSGPEMTAICTASGEWVLNPRDLDCDAGTGLSTAEAVGITFVLSSIVSFTAGLLVALVIAYCYIRQQKTNQYSPSEPKQPAPMYEDVSVNVRRDIELKENVAYRVVGQ